MRPTIHHRTKMLLLLALITGCASTESRWKDAQSANTIGAYERFLQTCPQGEYESWAKSRLEGLYFEEARRKNTAGAYEDFLERYPKGQHAALARITLEALYFEDARRTNTSQVYRDYLSRFPTGVYSSEASLRLELLSSGGPAADGTTMPESFWGTWVKADGGSLVIVGRTIRWERTGGSFDKGTETVEAFELRDSGGTVKFNSRQTYARDEFTGAGHSAPMEVTMRREGETIILECGATKPQQLTPWSPGAVITLPAERYVYTKK